MKQKDQTDKIATIAKASLVEEDDAVDTLEWKSGKKRPPSPAAVVALTLFTEALGSLMLRRLMKPEPALCICVTVPDATWAQPLREGVLLLDRVPVYSFYDSSIRRIIGDQPLEQLIENLNNGRALLCVSQDVRTAVPRALQTVADAHVELVPPTADQIAALIGMIRSGRRPHFVPSDLGHGLSFAEIVACLRGREAPRHSVSRIMRAMAAKTNIAVDRSAPRLEDLVGYGRAAAWGLRLRDDVVEFRAKRLSWQDLASTLTLHGPPGTGKTLFFRALSRTLDAPLISTTVGSWFQTGSGDLGGTVRAITAVFNEAKMAVHAHGVAILFIDEIDAIPNRAALDADRASWWSPVVNLILTLVDGATSDLSGIVLGGATNNLRGVDPALLRPGRLGTIVAVLPPDPDALAAIVRLHLGGDACGIPLGDIIAIMQPLQGATQARAAGWAADALRRAREAGRPVRLDDISSVAFPADSRSQRDRRRAAVHEAGHSVVACLLASERLVSTSIIETATASGQTTFRGQGEALLSRAEIEADVVIMLSGRAADVIVGDGATAGAGGVGKVGSLSDLAQATAWLTALHATFGMGSTLRYRSDPTGVPCPNDSELAGLVEADLQRLMQQAENRISEMSASVRAVAAVLLEKSYMTASEIKDVVDTSQTS